MKDFEQFLEMMIDRAKQAERLQKTVPTSDITGVLKHVLAEYLKPSPEVNHD